ncbi:MAG: hypothetical protein HYV61_13825 [Candidatus Rokubacteria bacterium]|nr:hypothetical protein [Candidatus Rokubacteria bacterium]
MGELLRMMARAVFFIGGLYIIGDAALGAYHAHDTARAVAALVFFPFTFLVHPWFAGLWWLQWAVVGSYWASVFLGTGGRRVEPVAVAGRAASPRLAFARTGAGPWPSPLGPSRAR